MEIRNGVALSGLTTLGLGGLARVLASIRHADDARAAMAAAQAEAAPICIVGGGSNLIAPDADDSGCKIDGWAIDGWVLHPVNREMTVTRQDHSHVWLTAGAGASWDDVVAFAVQQGWAGISCLSGIPGQIGAAPIQNIGAYGQELSAVFHSAEIMDLHTRHVTTWSATDCDFSYRDSRLKRGDGRFLVLNVTLRLSKQGSPTLRYGELSRLQGSYDATPTLADIRTAVLHIRRSKGMVHERDAQGDLRDPDSRSAGSYFVNPVVTTAAAERALERLQALQVEPLRMPRYAVQHDVSISQAELCKLSAAWLIDTCGMPPGYDHPDHGGQRVGLSSKHCLALINRGSATTLDLRAFEAHVQQRVVEMTGVALRREPVLLRGVRYGVDPAVHPGSATQTKLP